MGDGEREGDSRRRTLRRPGATSIQPSWRYLDGSLGGALVEAAEEQVDPPAGAIPPKNAP